MNLAEGAAWSQTRSFEEFSVRDIVVKNAGTLAMVPATDCPLDHWHTTKAVNVTATMLLMQHALSHMKQAIYAQIVDAASINSVRTGTAVWLKAHLGRLHGDLAETGLML